MRLLPTKYRRHPGSPAIGDVDALFRSAFRGFPTWGSSLDFDSFLRPVSPSLPVEVVENENDFVVRVEIPGVKREAVEVTIDGRTLTVEVTEPDVVDVDDGGSRRPSRSSSLTIPETVDTDAVKASLEDGILTLTLPKVAAAKPRAIAIE